MTGWIGLAGACVAVGVTVAMSASGIRQEFERQGSARVRQLALLVGAGLQAEDPGQLAAVIEGVAGAPDVIEAAGLPAAGGRLSSSVAGDLAPSTREALEAVLASGESRMIQGDAGGEPELLLAVPVFGGGDAELRGAAALRLSMAGLADARRTLILYNLSSALLGTAVMTFAAWWLLGWLLTPVSAVEEAIEALAQGDGSARLEPSELGALASVGSALNRLAFSQQAIDRRVGGMAARLEVVVERVLEAASAIRSEIDEQGEQAEVATARLAEAAQTVAEVEREIRVVSRSTGQAATSLAHLDGSLDRVAQRMNALGDRVDSSASASYEMAASIRQVTENAGHVRAAAQETAGSAAEIDRAIQAMGDAVREASELSGSVNEKAESGELAVRGIVASSEETRARAGEAREVHERLGALIAEISGIAESIEAINRETNMLALNASIAAAQAGESGRSFAVVADRVKTLASQTSASTAQIEQNLGALQQESGNASQALDSALVSVDRNLARARATGASFEGIRSSAEQATRRIKEIADLAARQGESSERVARAARTTSEMVDAIGVALEEQQVTSQQTSETAEAALEVCRQVQSEAREQRVTGRAATESIGAVDARMQTMLHGVGAHVHASQEVSEAVNNAFGRAETTAARMSGLVEAVEALRAEWDSLRAELGHLHAGGADAAAPE